MPRIDGGRFLLVDYLPTYAAVLFVVILVWAGAPGPHIDFGNAWRTAAHLGVGEVILIAIAITLLAVLTHPLQLAMMRVLEGGWPAWARPWRLCHGPFSSATGHNWRPVKNSPRIPPRP
jgi:hypothetical protein